MLGLRPWLAFLRRAFAFFFCVRFDMVQPPTDVALQGYRARVQDPGVRASLLGFVTRYWDL